MKIVRAGCDGGDRGLDLDDEDDDSPEESEDFRIVRRGRGAAPEAYDDDEDAIPGVADLAPAPIDLARLKSVLQDLVACRQLLEAALKDS